MTNTKARTGGLATPVSRRTLLAGTAAGRRRARAVELRQRGPLAAENKLKVGFISPRTGRAGRLRRRRRLRARPGPQDARQRPQGRRQDLRGDDPRPGHPVRPLARRPARQEPDQRRQGRHDAVDLDAGSGQSRSPTPARRPACRASPPSIRGSHSISAAAASRTASPFKWSFLFSFGTKQFADTYLSMWDKMETNKKVGVLYPNDADGNAVRENLGPLLEKGGYKIVDPGAYEDGTTDYSAQIALFKREKCEIFNTFPIPPDFAAFWRQAAQQGYTRMVKIAQIAKTGLFPSDVEALGSLGYNLAAAAYWHKVWPYKSSLTGVSRQGTRRRLRGGHRQAVAAAARRLDVAARCGLRGARGRRRPDQQGCRGQGACGPRRPRPWSARSTSPRARSPMSR